MARPVLKVPATQVVTPRAPEQFACATVLKGTSSHN